MDNNTHGYKSVTPDNDALAYLHAIERGILALSTNPAATDRLLTHLCDAYEWSNQHVVGNAEPDTAND